MDLRAIGDEIRAAMPDYLPDYDMMASMTSEQEAAERIKRCIAKALTPGERAILLLYAERGNMESVAQSFHVSRYTIWKEINNIRAKVIKELESGKWDL